MKNAETAGQIRLGDFPSDNLLAHAILELEFLQFIQGNLLSQPINESAGPITKWLGKIESD